MSPHTKDSLGKSVRKNSVNKKTLEESFFAFNNMDFRNHNHHMEDSLGTAGNMGDMEDNMGMDAGLTSALPTNPPANPPNNPPTNGAPKKKNR